MPPAPVEPYDSDSTALVGLKEIDEAGRRRRTWSGDILTFSRNEPPSAYPHPFG